MTTTGNGDRWTEVVVAQTREYSAAILIRRYDQFGNPVEERLPIDFLAPASPVKFHDECHLLPPSDCYEWHHYRVRRGLIHPAGNWRKRRRVLRRRWERERRI